MMARKKALEGARLTIPDAYREALQVAQEEQAAILAADPTRSIADPTLPVYRFVASNELEVERARFESGDQHALLGAVRLCANHDLVMPEWLSRAFIRAYDKVLTRKVKSWDDAFGKPLAEGQHLNAARKKREKGPAAWLEVRRMHDEEGMPIDGQTFELAGKRLGLGKTLVSEYYYDHERRWGVPTLAARAILEPYRNQSSAPIPEKRKTLRKYTPKR